MTWTRAGTPRPATAQFQAWRLDRQRPQPDEVGVRASRITRRPPLEPLHITRP